MSVMVVTHTDTKGQGQTSLYSKVRVETDGRTDYRTDGGDCITSRASAVVKYPSPEVFPTFTVSA